MSRPSTTARSTRLEESVARRDLRWTAPTSHAANNSATPQKGKPSVPIGADAGSSQADTAITTATTAEKAMSQIVRDPAPPPGWVPVRSTPARSV